MTKQVALVTGAAININGGLKAVVNAPQQIALVVGDVTIGAGVESMRRSGYLIPHARWGARMGDTKPLGMTKELVPPIEQTNKKGSRPSKSVRRFQRPARPEC